jgi:hypothetical protein
MKRMLSSVRVMMTVVREESWRRRSDVGGTAVGWAHYSRGANPQTSSQSV